jgi:hypothetical protein
MKQVVLSIMSQVGVAVILKWLAEAMQDIDPLITAQLTHTQKLISDQDRQKLYSLRAIFVGHLVHTHGWNIMFANKRALHVNTQRSHSCPACGKSIESLSIVS